MKTGYKFFIFSNIVRGALALASISISSTIENIWGTITLIALLHAFFSRSKQIVNSAPLPPNRVVLSDEWYEEQRELRYYHPEWFK